MGVSISGRDFPAFCGKLFEYTLEAWYNIEKDVIKMKMTETNWESLDISNDFLFGKVMQNPDLCKELLQRILPDLNIERIEYPELQKSIKEGAESRGIRLDVYSKDDKNIVYNVEMQANGSKGIPKRSRYYQGMIDLQLLEAGDKSYMKLNKTYIIFICTFDLYGKGRHIYTFENICKEDNSLSMGDEATKIFLNSDSDMDDVGKELRAFLDYVKGIKVTDDDFIDRLEEAVKRAKANKKWRRDYMTMEMLERVKYEEGREEGRKEEMERGITALVSTLKDMNVPIQVILEKVQEKFNLSLETAKKYI